MQLLGIDIIRPMPIYITLCLINLCINFIQDIKTTRIVLVLRIYKVCKKTKNEPYEAHTNRRYKSYVRYLCRYKFSWWYWQMLIWLLFYLSISTLFLEILYTKQFDDDVTGKNIFVSKTLIEFALMTWFVNNDCRMKLIIQ